MEEFKAFLLGLVQGMTEFLPVSSSGHVAIFGQYLNFGEGVFLLTLSLHLGSLLAIGIFFRARIRQIFLSLLRGGSWLENPERRLILLIIIGSIPTAIMGLFLRRFIVDFFTSTHFVATMLILNGLILFVAERFSPAKGRERIKITEALLIGLAQGIALLPGISRSGITIATGMLKGISKETAASYSFLLSIPAILGAAAIEFFGHKDELSLGAEQIWPHLVGIIAAFISGWACLGLLFWFLKTKRLKVFAAYCLIIGIGTLVVGNW